MGLDKLWTVKKRMEQINRDPENELPLFVVVYGQITQSLRKSLGVVIDVRCT